MDKIYIWVRGSQIAAYSTEAKVLITKDEVFEWISHPDMVDKMVKEGYEYDVILTQAWGNIIEESSRRLDAMCNDIFFDTTTTMSAVAIANDVDCIYSGMDDDQPCWGKVTCVGNDSVTGIPVHACKGHAFFINGDDYFPEDQ